MSRRRGRRWPKAWKCWSSPTSSTRFPRSWKATFRRSWRTRSETANGPATRDRSGSGCLQDGLQGPLEIRRRRGPAADADAHGLAPVPARAAAPAFAGLLETPDRRFRPGVAAKGGHHLVQDDLVQDLDACALQFGAEPRGLVAVAIDEPGKAAAPQRLECSPDVEAARAPRAVRREVDGVLAAE